MQSNDISRMRAQLGQAGNSRRGGEAIVSDFLNFSGRGMGASQPNVSALNDYSNFADRFGLSISQTGDSSSGLAQLLLSILLAVVGGVLLVQPLLVTCAPIAAEVFGFDAYYFQAGGGGLQVIASSGVLGGAALVGALWAISNCQRLGNDSN